MVKLIKILSHLNQLCLVNLLRSYTSSLNHRFFSKFFSHWKRHPLTIGNMKVRWGGRPRRIESAIVLIEFVIRTDVNFTFGLYPHQLINLRQIVYSWVCLVVLGPAQNLIGKIIYFVARNEFMRDIEGILAVLRRVYPWRCYRWGQIRVFCFRFNENFRFSVMQFERGFLSFHKMLHVGWFEINF